MGILSLLPIVMAVGLALYTKNAVFSLFCGLVCASLLINIDQPLMGVFYVFDPLLTQALAEIRYQLYTAFTMLGKNQAFR